MAKCAVPFPLGILLTAYLLVLIQCNEFEPLITGDNRSAISNVRLDVSSGSLEDSFRTINRRKLSQCTFYSPYLQLTLDTAGPLSDVQTVTVTVSGILSPSASDFVAVVSPSSSSIEDCPGVEVDYLTTGDTSQLALLCHYPVKFKFVDSDPNYLSCANSQCRVSNPFGGCLVKTCSASLSFRLINIRTDILFVSFTNGLQDPCILKQTGPLSFANPSSPLSGHLSSIDSSGTSMRLTWVSGDPQSQTVQYASGRTISSTVSTFTPANLCSPGAANDFGWHNPGYIHTAVMTGLSPSTHYSYQYGSQKVGQSANATFTTPHAGGDNQVSIIIYGDMGKAERDNSYIHYIQEDKRNDVYIVEFGTTLQSVAIRPLTSPGRTTIVKNSSTRLNLRFKMGNLDSGFFIHISWPTIFAVFNIGREDFQINDRVTFNITPGSLSVIDAVTKAVNTGGIDFVFHIGDISYATGFLVEWDNFLELIHPIASQVSYMTAIGNHERDNPNSGSYYGGPDSGGECGIPYYRYFQMPTPATDKPWYSIESGPVHFTIMSTEDDWRVGTEQYNWIKNDLASVNRKKTPWVIFAGHRPMYSSIQESLLEGITPSVDPAYTAAIEPLLFQGQVDLALAGHVHNYERTCAVYQGNCLQNASKDISGVDTFSFTTSHAPVQAVVGMAGFSLDSFKSSPDAWSTIRISAYGYAGIKATAHKLTFTFTNANGAVGDTFAIEK